MVKMHFEFEHIQLQALKFSNKKGKAELNWAQFNAIQYAEKLNKLFALMKKKMIVVDQPII